MPSTEHGYENRYSLPQIVLHWLTLLMIILTYLAMLLSDTVPDEERTFVRTCILIWYFCLAINVSAALAAAEKPDASHFATVASLAVIGCPYFALGVVSDVPITADSRVLTQAYGGRTWLLLGWQVPQWLTPNTDVRDYLKQTHVFIANLGYFVIGIHGVAALYHHYIRRDDTLRRMMPGK